MTRLTDGAAEQGLKKTQKINLANSFCLLKVRNVYLFFRLVVNRFFSCFSEILLLINHTPTCRRECGDGARACGVFNLYVCVQKL